MSSKDDPFSSDGRTVIGQAGGRDPVSAARRQTKDTSTRIEGVDATVFDPGFAAKAAESSRTVIAGEALSPASNAAKPQHALLEANKRIAYPSANPLVGAAGPALILLGHLREAPTSLDPALLAEHFTDAIDEFDRKIAHSDVTDSDARIARYALCETIDDIVPNLPGFDRDAWIEQGMLSRFFRADEAGVGFFDALNTVLAEPEQHLDLIELMHACLVLGFEGQYRNAGDHGVGLQRVRQDVFETLRYFRSKPADDLSPHWQGLAVKMQKPRARVPLWAIAAASLALVAGVFVELRSLATNQGDALAQTLLLLDPKTPVTIERTAFSPVTEAAPKPEPAAPVVDENAQLERIRSALAEEIAASKLTVDSKGEFIVVEINNLELFQPGKATLKPEFAALAKSVAAALDAEPGPIRVVGHTDSEKPGRASAFKSNYDLSVARATAVEQMLAPMIEDASRLAVEGKGEDEPIADNTTQEGRAKNRRVDLMIPRQETL